MIDLDALGITAVNCAVIHHADQISKDQRQTVEAAKLAMIQSETASHPLHASEIGYAAAILRGDARIALKLESC